MKRDWDLIYLILKKLQDDDHQEIDVYDDEEVFEHQGLLIEAGLIECEDTFEDGTMPWHMCRLTWQGHEFIESAQNKGIYDQAIDKASAVGSVSFEIIKTLIAEIVKRSIFGA